LQRALLQAQRVDWSLEDRRFVLFQGTPEQMEFVTPLSDYVGIGGLYLVRVFLREQEGSRALMLERWLLHPEILAGGDGIPEWQPLEPSRDAADDQDSALGVYGSAVLLEDVGAVNFGYYGPQLEDDAETWQGEWSERPAMPRLVRLQLEHHGEVWVDLVVPLVGG
jgi:general secretion pathway protein J